MDLVTFLLFIISITWISAFIFGPSKLPPGPYRLPIIGNILELGPKPHQSLTKLSRKYGPLMSLKLGSRTTIVVSSPELAKIVLQKHDITCSSRTVPSAIKFVEHDKFSIVWLPVENQWRMLRKICREQMFSVSRLDASQGMRREKLQKLFDHVDRCAESGRVVDIEEAAFTTTMNMVSATLFSLEFANFDSNSSQEMMDVMWGVLESIAAPNLADYFPLLKSMDLQGLSKRTKIHFDKLFAIFDDIIDEKLKSRGDDRNDLLDVLIDINQRDESELTRNDIKSLLLDLLIAGTDTSATTVEWAMTELLRHPDKMSRVRDEIRKVIEEKGQVEETDISKLPYLQAVVKETFRLHPVAPFLVPHKAESQVETNGYIIPKDAQILVNVWAIGRDPNTWTNAEAFEPERFINSEVDFRGKDFELIPFGAGRRICPGLPLGYRMVHLMVATLAGNFGWKLEDNIKPHEIDMDEKFGLGVQKVIPLKAVPFKF